MSKAIKLRGDVAELSVTHPTLGTELVIGAHSIRIGPEQYFALVDELCQIAFLVPHMAARVQSLAREIGVCEVSQYVMWQAEADRAAAQRVSVQRISVQATGPQTVQRTWPTKQKRGKGKNDEGNNTADSDGRAADARGGHDPTRGRRRSLESDDSGIAQGKPRQRLPDGTRAAHAPQYTEPEAGRS